MTFGITVLLPATGAFGTDDEFDLRARLERDFGAALAADCTGECGLGETEGGRACIHLEAVRDPDAALRSVQRVLGTYGLLDRATVLLEAPDPADPDEVRREVLWPRPGFSAGR